LFKGCEFWQNETDSVNLYSNVDIGLYVGAKPDVLYGNKKTKRKP